MPQAHTWTPHFATCMHCHTQGAADDEPALKPHCATPALRHARPATHTHTSCSHTVSPAAATHQRHVQETGEVYLQATWSVPGTVPRHTCHTPYSRDVLPHTQVHTLSHTACRKPHKRLEDKVRVGLFCMHQGCNTLAAILCRRSVKQFAAMQLCRKEEPCFSQVEVIIPHALWCKEGCTAGLTCTNRPRVISMVNPRS